MQASVELSRVEEDLLREKHAHELRTKNLVLDIEQKSTKVEEVQRVYGEREEVLKNIIRAYEGQRSLKEIDNLKGMSSHVVTEMSQSQ